MTIVERLNEISERAPKGSRSGNRKSKNRSGKHDIGRMKSRKK